MNGGIYYTYAWLREDGTPYYVGKGKNHRAWRKGSPPKERVLILKKGLCEQDAFKHEVYMIFVLGRKDKECGILRNRTDGGEGCAGHFWKHTEEWRAKASASMKGKNKGRKHSEEFKELKRQQALGRMKSAEEKQKISEALTGRARSKDSVAKSTAFHLGRKRPQSTCQKVRDAKNRKFKCLETGFVSTDGGLTKFQKRRGIDVSLREEVLQ